MYPKLFTPYTLSLRVVKVEHLGDVGFAVLAGNFVGHEADELIELEKTAAVCVQFADESEDGLVFSVESERQHRVGEL